jgi:hypothetical protein
MLGPALRDKHAASGPTFAGEVSRGLETDVESKIRCGAHGRRLFSRELWSYPSAEVEHMLVPQSRAKHGTRKPSRRRMGAGESIGQHPWSLPVRRRIQGTGTRQNAGGPATSWLGRMATRSRVFPIRPYLSHKLASEREIVSGVARLAPSPGTVFPSRVSSISFRSSIALGADSAMWYAPRLSPRPSRVPAGRLPQFLCG